MRPHEHRQERSVRLSQGANGSAADAAPLTTLVADLRGSGRFLERKDPLPFVLHADHHPAAAHGVITEFRGERANLGILTVGIFPGGVVMVHEHREPGSGAGLSPFEHLPTPPGRRR